MEIWFGGIEFFKRLIDLLKKEVFFIVLKMNIIPSALLNDIYNKLKGLRDVGFGTFDKMYETGVMSVCNYAAEIWGYKDFKLQKYSKSSYAILFRLHKFAPIAGMQGDLGWLATKFRRYICMVIFWNRTMKMDDSTLVKHIFNYDYGIMYLTMPLCVI